MSLLFGSGRRQEKPATTLVHITSPGASLDDRRAAADAKVAAERAQRARLAAQSPATPADPPMTDLEAWSLVARFMAEQRSTSQPTVQAAPAPRADRDALYAQGLPVLGTRPTHSPASTFGAGPPAATLSEVDRRRLLGCTDLGRRVLAKERQQDPAAFAAGGGLTPERRRELLSGGPIGRAVLAEEDRQRRSR